MPPSKLSASKSNLFALHEILDIYSSISNLMNLFGVISVSILSFTLFGHGMPTLTQNVISLKLKKLEIDVDENEGTKYPPSTMQ